MSPWALMPAALLAWMAYAIGVEVGRTDAGVIERDLDNPCGRACVRFCEELQP